MLSPLGFRGSVQPVPHRYSLSGHWNNSHPYVLCGVILYLSGTVVLPVGLGVLVVPSSSSFFVLQKLNTRKMNFSWIICLPSIEWLWGTIFAALRLQATGPGPFPYFVNYAARVASNPVVPDYFLFMHVIPYTYVSYKRYKNSLRVSWDSDLQGTARASNPVDFKGASLPRDSTQIPAHRDPWSCVP